ncbi:MAG: transglycosylase SLT domain-containing protein [Acidimicrobiales bacterium]|nr:transglycosylase SLT domain-containing protein [Acidimicrobiales bacterium]
MRNRLIAAFAVLAVVLMASFAVTTMSASDGAVRAGGLMAPDHIATSGEGPDADDSVVAAAADDGVAFPPVDDRSDRESAPPAAAEPDFVPVPNMDTEPDFVPVPNMDTEPDFVPVPNMDPAPAPAPAPAPSYAPGSVEDIIARHFGPATQKALAVVQCESNFNPSAMSPGGGNHGLFQINNVHAGTWPSVTGTPWSNRYSAEANTVFAKWLYNQQGWGPWACA